MKGESYHEKECPFCHASDAPQEEAAPETETPAAEAPAPAEAEASAETIEEPEGEPVYGNYYMANPDLTPFPANDGTVISVWTTMPLSFVGLDSSGDVLAWQMLAEATGYDFDFTDANPETAATNFMLMAAANDFTDIIFSAVNYYTGGGGAAIEDGMIIDFAEYISEYIPNLQALMDADPSLARDVSTDDGYIPGVFSVLDHANYDDTGYAIRQDLLDKLGLEVPKTFDQVHDVLTALVNDGNGGLAIGPSGVSIQNNLVDGFGVYGEYTSVMGANPPLYVEGDQVKYGHMEQGFRDYIQTMADWYAEGLIYHDFPFYGNELNFRDPGAVGAGQVACFRSETGDMAMFGDFSEDPDILFTAMAPVGKNEGDTIHMTDMAPSRADTLRWSVTTGCEDPELIIAMVDYLYSEEGALLCNYGIEGETFDFDEQGVPHFSDLIYNNPEYDYRTAVFIYVMDAGPTVVDPMRGAGTYTQEQLDSWGIWAADNLDYSGVIPARVTLKAEDSEYNNIASDIETFMDEYTVKYVTGELSFDTYDTDFVEKLRSMDAERMVELYQDAYDEYLAG